MLTNRNQQAIHTLEALIRTDAHMKSIGQELDKNEFIDLIKTLKSQLEGENHAN